MKQLKDTMKIGAEISTPGDHDKKSRRLSELRFSKVTWEKEEMWPLRGVIYK